MTQDNFKKQAVSGTIWKFLERFIAQGITLVVSIIIARILNPSDYSTVSIVTIFFTFANVFISGGLNTALIQKKDASEKDYSIVLYISLFISLIIYFILFFTAPFIADLYKDPVLILVIRIMGISLPVNAIKSIWCAYISSTFQFKKFFYATLGGTIFSAIVGIVMALQGFGVWALVAQQLSNSVIDTLILIISTKIHISIKGTTKNVKTLFQYGWKVFLSSLIATAYNEVTPLIVGYKFSPESLSFYTKGRSFPTTFSSATTNTLSSVLFPFLSKVQDDKQKVLAYTRRYMQLASYISFPLMLGFFAVADHFVIALLTDKWLGAVYFLRVFCICAMFDVIAVGNCETVKAIGRSDIYLIMEIIKKILYLIVIVIFIVFAKTPEILTFSSIVCVLIQIIVNTIPNKKLIGYSYRMQLMDLLPNLALSLFMTFGVILLGYFIANSIIALIVQVFAGVFLYVFSSLIFKNKSLAYLLDLLKAFFARNSK